MAVLVSVNFDLNVIVFFLLYCTVTISYSDAQRRGL